MPPSFSVPAAALAVLLFAARVWASDQGEEEDPFAEEKPPPAPIDWLKLVDKFRYDSAAVLFVLAYALWYLYGQSQNASIIRQIAKAVRPVLRSQFAQTGYGAADSGTGLTWTSDDTAEIWSSGRKNCNGMLVSIQLQPRQDLYHTLIASNVLPRLLGFVGIPAALLASSLPLAGSTSDTITVEVPLEEHGARPAEDCILALVPARDEKAAAAYVAARSDLSTYCTEVKEGALKESGIPTGYMAWADTREVVAAVLPPSVLAQLPALGSDLKEIHVTDRAEDIRARVSVVSKKMLRLVFTLPPGVAGAARDDLLASFILQACAVTDHVARMQLSTVVSARRGGGGPRPSWGRRRGVTSRLTLPLPPPHHPPCASLCRPAHACVRTGRSTSASWRRLRQRSAWRHSG